MHAITTEFELKIFDDSPQACAEGYNYHTGRWEKVTPLKIKQVIRTLDGTKGHNDTLDIIMVDEQGREYVTLVTGNLMRSALGGRK